MSEPIESDRADPLNRKSKSKSKVEGVKEESHGLRGTIASDLASDADSFGETSKQLLKFHGLYQQEDRDRRAARSGKTHSFMLRSKIPGGRLTPEQYLVHDDLAGRYANGTLRITTRQDFQLHGVLKGDVTASVRAINDALVTTLGACGDVVRNVMCCPLPAIDASRRAMLDLAREISDRTAPRTTAYHEIWLDGENVVEPVANEPLYGAAYLPRKFKIGMAWPGDNCVDVYTHDLGLIGVVANDHLEGFNVLVGGGLGMTHKKPETFPRLADPLAFVEPDRLVQVVEQIVLVQRDHGDRADRRHARLKYLIHDRGLAWFRAEVEARLGRALALPVRTPPMSLDLHLGWREQGDGRCCVGLSVENGRIVDRGSLRLRSGLRAIVERHGPAVILTPNQDLLLADIPAGQRVAVAAALREHGIAEPGALPSARPYSMACPALPTCGLALAEAERALPGVIDELDCELTRQGLAGERITVRMTGCPNGCARPYVADIGFVGRSADRYVIRLGGRSDGTRLNQVYEDLVPREALVATVAPLLRFFRARRRGGESFGDFCDRVGVDALRQYARTHLRVAVNE